MKRILLYYPPVTPVTQLPTWEPLQLLSLARVFRDTDFEVEIIDGRLFPEEKRKAEVSRRLSGGEVCFGITALTCYQLLDALAIAGRVKELRPDLPVVFGGWHATVFADETLREACVDIVVRGQGEVTFREVVERLSGGNGVEGVEGVSWKKAGVVTHENDRPLISPDELPPLIPADFEALSLEHYQTGSVLFYMASVGCPYSCRYCNISSACKRKWLPLSAARVIDELDGLRRRFGFREVVFWDNVFFTSKRRVQDICGHLIREGAPFSWSAHARINEVITWDDDFLGTLKQSGCKAVFIGAESGSQELLDRIDKKINARDIIPSFRKLRDHGIGAAVNWMVGFPDETYADLQRTARCIREGLRLYDYDTERFKVFIYRFVPFPHTPIFGELDKATLEKLPATAREWGKFIHEKVNDGMEPWKEEGTPSLFPSTTFFLWKAYLQQIASPGPRARLLRTVARMRIATGFLRFPVEWWLWKRKQWIRG